jgi:hypothetical protein
MAKRRATGFDAQEIGHDEPCRDTVDLTKVVKRLPLM